MIYLASAYGYGLHGSVRNVLVKVPKGVMLAKALAGAGAGAEARAKARARVLLGRASSDFVFNIFADIQSFSAINKVKFW